MDAVFLGGSRKIARLNESVRSRLDGLLEGGFWIFVGDANGADRAFQKHLHARGYERVLVYSVSGRLRNNVGHWKVRFVDAPAGSRGFDLYSVKDVQMANDASRGLMLWDGKSRGTLANVRNLLAQRKPVAVHLSPARRFVTLESLEDLPKLGVERAHELDRQTTLSFGDPAPDRVAEGPELEFDGDAYARSRRKRASGLRRQS